MKSINAMKNTSFYVTRKGAHVIVGQNPDGAWLFKVNEQDGFGWSPLHRTQAQSADAAYAAALRFLKGRKK